jgi:3-oxoacyl-(acyl-carrier-protein) synthase/pimeloyl-ACP methyl ester carboxylesterase/aryl carrier-like protein
MEQDKIVIVGTSCRFAGANSVKEYWENLLRGKDCLSGVTRWGSDSGIPGRGGFLDDISSFDASFFRISPNEARCMDPQQRVLMEVVHHCIEDSTLPVSCLRELRCGVFCTSLPGDYKFVLAGNREMAFSTQSFMGNAPSSLSGRISYYYDLSGPSLTLDTACSSSLTALQIACLNLQAGACEAAIVGAVSVFSTSEVFEFARRANMLSAVGRCAAFAETADGFVPAEGAAAIILMKASSAASLGLPISGTIEAIGINHGGQSNGLMAPNSHGQADLICSTYRHFEISVDKIGYVEAHGTGTTLGDPLEMSALVSAYRSQSGQYSCYVGASKAVIGHTLVCSGLASILKALLILKNRIIPPHSVAAPINCNIDFDRFLINSAPVAWPNGKEFCAVSSFGFTGSNGHVVLRVPTEPAQSVEIPGPHPFLFSADTETSLRRNLREYLRMIGRLPESQLPAMSVAQGRNRQFYKIRVAVIAGSSSDLSAGIFQLLEHPEGKMQRTVIGPQGLLGKAMSLAMKRWLEGENAWLYDNALMAKALKVDLPLYSFERKSYWAGTPAAHQSTKPGDPMPQNETATLERLKQKVAEVLGFCVHEIDVSRSLRDLGIDSLSGLKVMSEFGNAACRIRPHELFAYPSLESLAADLRLSELSRRPEGTGTTSISRDPIKKVKAMPGKFIQWQRMAETGKPLLLLPPLNMSTKAWIQQLPLLKRNGYLPIVAIYPGHLENPAQAEGITYDLLLQEMVEYVETALEGCRTPVLGWSLGGCFGLGLALRAAQRLSSLVLISTAARFDDNVFNKTIDLNGELERHADYLDLVFGPGDTVSKQVGAGATMDVLQHYYQMLGQFDVSGALKNIHTSTVIVHGTQDVVISERDVQLLRELPNSAIKEFAGKGHFIPLTAARPFNEMALQFLAATAE